ncbi:hypothetical protein [Microvirga zambiensis]|uniref:hypothetical protein n=1 Tax=Microvirga zambiensis TaxID=1402137 RepID=UPI00191EEE0A|nr:hypothetical protein [Microvirga zambiensis]
MTGNDEKVAALLAKRMETRTYMEDQRYIGDLANALESQQAEIRRLTKALEESHKIIRAYEDARLRGAEWPAPLHPSR